MDREIEDLLVDVRAQQDRVLEIQRAVERLEIVGYCPGGEVTARLRGNGRLIDLVIDPQAYRRFPPETFAALVVEAVSDGQRRLAEACRERFAPVLAEALERLDGPDR
ncbi:MAG TPA: YbaB/EbfC family nucleoid-associated protein [Rugosimonospora sp.]|nr:YbaB/EbfC family nucleoid-associated protein [Rugosimonospora sp.]